MRPNSERRVLPWGELPRGTRPFDGLVIVDKPAGVTSHDVVGAMRRLAGTRHVGHAGTLDPMATGVLCVGVGRATKLLQYVTGTNKEYTATIRLGIETSTEDADGEVTAVHGIGALGPASSWRGAIEQAMAHFTGTIEQVPSSVSAVKVNGRRAYERVRAGEHVTLPARRVTVSRFALEDAPHEVMDGAAVEVDVAVTVSSGTYVRALARDVGQRLGTGAHLTRLRRTRVGAWDEGRAVTIESLAGVVSAGGELPHVTVSEVCVALFPIVTVTEEQAEELRHGQFIDASRPHGEPPYAAMFGNVAVALVSARAGKLKPDLQV